MAENSKFQQKIKELYPEEVFSEKEMAKMERDVIDFFTLLATEYNKQEYKKSLQKWSKHHKVQIVSDKQNKFPKQ